MNRGSFCTAFRGAILSPAFTLFFLGAGTVVGAAACARGRAATRRESGDAVRGSASPVGGISYADVESLPSSPELPELLRFAGGARVRSPAEWPRRRAEILGLLDHYQYGRMPPPYPVDAEILAVEEIAETPAKQTTLRLRSGREERVAFRVALTTPHGAGPFPAIVKNHHGLDGCPIRGEVIRRGYALAIYDREEIDPDDPTKARGARAIDPDFDGGTLTAWAWGTSRVIDHLTTLPAIDRTRIVATGHSRGGKAALLAAAHDERVAVAAPNGSGAGGCGQYRFIPPERRGPWSRDTTNIETLASIQRKFPYWFAPRLAGFADREDRLPFDQHFLKAAVAPRALICTEASDDHWANPEGARATNAAAREVFAFLGVPDRIGLHVRTGGHEQTAEDWRALMDFADRQLGRR